MGGLHDMKQICKYCNRSAATILTWIRTRDFPAVKIGGSWESDTELIDEWRKNEIKADIQARTRPRRQRKW